MSSQFVLTLMGIVEFLLWAVLGVLFWKKRLHKRFRALGWYLALHIVSGFVLLPLYYGSSRHWLHNYCIPCYFWSYWAIYLASAVLLYFVCVEVFRSAFWAFKGVLWFGTVAFRWVAVVSVILSLSAFSLDQNGALLITTMSFSLMRSVSLLELCLLAFICLSMNSLRLSMREMSFGISLGLGVMASSDFILSAFSSRKTTMYSPLQFVIEGVILCSLGLWAAYFILPEPARKPIIIPARSFVVRFNEIATSFGYPNTHVAYVSSPDGITNDAEKKASRRLSGNLLDRDEVDADAAETQTV